MYVLTSYFIHLRSRFCRYFLLLYYALRLKKSLCTTNEGRVVMRIANRRPVQFFVVVQVFTHELTTRHSQTNCWTWWPSVATELVPQKRLQNVQDYGLSPFTSSVSSPRVSVTHIPFLDQLKPLLDQLKYFKRRLHEVTVLNDGTWRVTWPTATRKRVTVTLVIHVIDQFTSSKTIKICCICWRVLQYFYNYVWLHHVLTSRQAAGIRAHSKNLGGNAMLRQIPGWSDTGWDTWNACTH